MTREDLMSRLQRKRKTGIRSDEEVARVLSGKALPGHVPGLPRPERAYTPAAVLVPLIDRPDDITVLLTQRTDHLTHHPGQISFPGGRIEDDDENAPQKTALRETEEEIGLSADKVEIIGRLDDYYTGTDYHIVPVIGWIEPPFDLTPEPFEVADVFEVPLSFLLDERNYRKDVMTYRGSERWFHAVPYRDRYIWGATAGMLVNLRDVLKSSS